MIPHIKVVVQYGDDHVEHIGAHFIDAIGFLVQCEAGIRRSQNIKEPVDVKTTQINKENLAKLLGENK